MRMHCWAVAATMGVVTFGINHSTAYAEQAVAAQTVVDSVGMNIHLGFADTVYTKNFPLIVTSLQALHVHHVRDGVMNFGAGDATYYQHHRQLAGLGIHADLISSLGQSESFLEGYPAHVGDMEALEAPNEADTQAGPSWPSLLQNFLPVLHAVDSTAAYKNIALIGPSLVDPNWYSTSNSYAVLGNVSSNFSFGNLHDYVGWRNPGTTGWSSQGYASIGWAVNTAQQAWSQKPVIATETGYHTNLPASQSIPEDVQVKYIPRLVLEQFMHGIRRSYLYELADDQYSGGDFGLLRSDGSPKPAYCALVSLMSELANSKRVTPDAPAITVTSANSAVNHLLVERRPGDYLLIVWQEVPSFDGDTGVYLPVTAASATVNVGPGLHILTADHIGPGGTLEPESTRKTLSVDDSLTLLEIQR